MAKTIDLTGQRFGRLVVLRKVGFFNGRSVWECQCDCGKIAQAVGKAMKNIDKIHDIARAAFQGQKPPEPTP
jgi:hypothetical protein